MLGIPRFRDSRLYSKQYFINKLNEILDKEGGKVTIKVLEEKYDIPSHTLLRYFQMTSIKDVWDEMFELRNMKK